MSGTSVRHQITLFATGLIVVLWPGVLAGGGLAYLGWANLQTPHRTRWLFGAALGTIGVFVGGLVPVWVAWPEFGAEVFGQALLGPLILQAAYSFRRGPVGPVRNPISPSPAQPEQSSTPEPAEGRAMLRLGRQGGRAYELPLPDCLAQHVSIPGATGTGKTTTIVKIAEDAVLGAGMAVIFVDAKGTGSLRDAAEVIADREELAFRLVDPDDPDTMKYNPASGSPSQVSNKLVGAFSYGGGEVFKQIAQATIPQLAKVLEEAREPVNLRTLATHLDRSAISKLAARTKTSAAMELLQQFKSEERVQTTGLVGMQSRLNALRFGGYRPIFEDSQESLYELDLANAFEDGVTYISLSAMASSEDSEVMARVLIQDAKQVAADRIRQKRKTGHEPQPALLVLDEFAAFREADQIVDLLLQARESRIYVVLSTQQVPESPALRKSFLDAGLLICHRVEPQGARDVAAAMGKRRRANVTTYLGGEGSGEADEDERYGSVRMDDHYAVDPDYVIGKLETGRAAVQARYGTTESRRAPAVVDIQMPKTMREA